MTEINIEGNNKFPWVNTPHPAWNEKEEEMHRIWSDIFETGIRKIIQAGIILLMLVFTINTGAASVSEPVNDTVGDAVQSGSNDINATYEDVNATVEDIEEYDGPIGPGNALYGLKLAFENLDESFTFNETEKLGKQVMHARLRIAEARSEFRKNNSKGAERALEVYKEKMNETDKLVSEFKDNDSGLANAQEKISKHQKVLGRLLASHPDNKGLERAYNNSQQLGEKFKHKIEQKEEREDNEGEKITIGAEIIENATKVKVEVKFESNTTEKNATAQEILNKLDLSPETINNTLKLEGDEENEVPTPNVTVNGTPTETLTIIPTSSRIGAFKEKLDVEVKVENGISKVKVDFEFPLNNTDRAGIIDGIRQKLSTLSADDILKALEMKSNINGKEVKKEDKQAKKEAKREIKVERKDNRDSRNED
jgi:hypothetical protein